MSTKAALMVYARVVQALAAAGEEPEHLDHLHCQQMVESINREFERLGVKIEEADLRRKSALEIAEVITEKIAA